MDAQLADPDWIELEGAANVRDVGGLPTRDGRRTRAHVLIRSDNLQDLSVADVEVLVGERDVRAVADLRTGIEVASTGPNRLHSDTRVAMQHLSLFPEVGRTTDAEALGDGTRPPILPWHNRSDERGAGAVYLGYTTDRPDSLVAAVRLIAHTDGATVVHCAAGKDRTGVVVALALDAVGVERDAIVADYVRSADRIEAILARLRGARTYQGDTDNRPPDRHAPRAATMQAFLTGLDEQYGAGVGAIGFLRAHGWTDEDQQALERHLVG